MADTEHIAVCTPDEIRALIARLPRVRLVDHPSPLQEWGRLAADWQPGSTVLAKRDDLIGVGLGGNKSRQLEFLLGAAMEAGADVIVHGGAIQSNYCRQLAAACAQLGLECHLVLSTAYGQPTNQGSHLLSRLFGARVSTTQLPLGAQHEQLKAQLRDSLRAEGRAPYLITYPESEVLGAFGYMLAAAELFEQLSDDTSLNAVVTSAVGASYVGMLLGLRMLGLEVPVVGFAPLAGEYPIAESVAATLPRVADELSIALDPSIQQQIDIRFTEVGPGYAVSTARSRTAMVDCGRLQGVALDPVYTAKACAGMRTLLEPERSTVFLHTGGAPALFAYAMDVVEALKGAGNNSDT